MSWTRAWSWQDVKKTRAAAHAWKPNKAAERRYAKQLKSVGKEVSALLEKGGDPVQVKRKLEAYSSALEPWAEQAAANMVRSCKRKNEQTWRSAADQWGIDIKGLLGVDIENAVRERIETNIQLIKSIPAQAAHEVGAMAQEALATGLRADQLAEKIAARGNVAMSRAKTIARTEISKTGTALTRARAQGVGSEGYIWRTARDGGTRPSHAAMEGRFVRWDQPPTLDGMTGHAGEFPNDRCYPEPVVHDTAGAEVAAPIPTMREEKQSGEHKLRSLWERTGYNPVTPHTEGRPLHNVDRAGFVLDKLTKYSMDPDSPRGKHKAKVWQAALGMDKSHAEDVQQQIMERLPGLPALKDSADEHGERFSVLVPITGPNGRTVDVTTAWIYKRTNGSVSTKPRLVTCFVGK